MLASTSPYRRRLLGRLGLEFEVASPEVDEERAAPAAAPATVAQVLARKKAEAVAARAGAEAVVLGSDQVCALGAERLGKPGSVARACDQLARLSGRTHELITAVAIVHSGGIDEFVDRTRLTMRALTRAEIEAYVARDEPLDCAGSYKLEAAGIGLFERIESADWTAIEGLPLLATAGALRRLGVA